MMLINPKHPLLAAVFLATLIAASGNILTAQSGWSTVESGTSADLNRIDWPPPGYETPSQRFYHVVGASGTFLSSDDAGSTWTLVPGVPTTVDLNDVSFSHPDTGYIVGDDWTIIKVQRFGGGYQFTTLSTNPAAADLNSVSSIPLTVSAFIAGDSGTVLRTVTRGIIWIPQFPGTARNINSLKMVTVARIFACGDSGLILRSLTSGVWTKLPVGAAYQSTRFNAVETAGSFGDTAWIVGDSGAILMTRNMASPIPNWVGVESGVTTSLRSVRNVTGVLWAVGDSGVILKSVNGGYNWIRQESGTTEDLRDVRFADPMDGVIVGRNGTILRTATGGGYRPISCSPGNLHFGKVINGAVKNGVFTVWNTFDAPLDLTIGAPANPRFTISPPVATLPASGSATFTVKYAPSAVGPDTSSFTVGVDAGAYETGFWLSGEGVDSLPRPAWSWLNPLPQGNPLNDIGFFDAANGIAVGDAGTIVRTADGGQTWSAAHYSAGLDARLLALDILDGQRAVAVGEDGLVLSSTDRGATWANTRTLGPVDWLNSVSFAGVDTGYAIGMGAYQDPSAGSIYRTTDGGVTWANNFFGSGDPGMIGREFPWDVATTGTGVAVVVGWKQPPGSSVSGLILRSTDAGGHWSRIQGPLPELTAVTFIDDSTGIAVGFYSILRTTDAGATWSEYPTPPYDYLIDVAFSGQNGIAVGEWGQPVVSSSDGGATWAQVSAPGPGIWRAVTFAGPGPAFGLDATATIYASTDLGATWKPRSQSVESHDITSVAFKNASQGVAISAGGGILKTGDGGATWTSLTGGTLLAFAGHDLTSAAYVQPDAITVVGTYGAIFRSDDGGSIWQEQYSGTSATLADISFADAEIGYIVGEGGTILRTTDAGAHWRSQTTSDKSIFSGVEAVGGNGAVIVGENGTILRTTDGGLNWHSAPSGTTASLADIDLVGDSGIVVGGDGTVLVTTDGGGTWQSKAAGTLNALMGVSLSASGVGTAVGTWGTIIRTIDAGTTWTTIPSGTQASFHDVAFLDDLMGIVVGSGGVMLRTTTGGVPAAVISDIPAPSVPGWYRLDQNYPNPFNPVTTIRYRLPVESKVVLRIYDMLGRVVTTLVDGVRQPGEQRAVWDARGVASGVYVYRLEATGLNGPGDRFTRDIRMVLVR
jgi:photosystem II stability/assembly factor-like uncharacterized protein